MTDIQLYTALSTLPQSLKTEVINFMEFLRYKSSKKNNKPAKRIAGKAKGLITLNSDFDDPINGFNDYMK